jgi:uncharacterized protein YcbX
MNASVAAILVAPVKGLRIGSSNEVELGVDGVRENRRFFLIDEDASLINGKSLATLHTIVADYSDAERTLSLIFPDGTRVSGAVAHGQRVGARFFASTVAAIEVVGPWSEALSQFAGRPLRLVESMRPCGAVDRGEDASVSLVSSASVERLALAAGAQSPVDVRRFRMLFEIDGVQAHEEDSWLNRRLAIGEAVVMPLGHVGRCVVTKRDPDSGVSDLDTLGALASYRRDAPTTEPLGCGVYGSVIKPGVVRLADAVELI